MSTRSIYDGWTSEREFWFTTGAGSSYADITLVQFQHIQASDGNHGHTRFVSVDRDVKACRESDRATSRSICSRVAILEIGL